MSGQFIVDGKAVWNIWNRLIASFALHLALPKLSQASVLYRPNQVWPGEVGCGRQLQAKPSSGHAKGT